MNVKRIIVLILIISLIPLTFANSVNDLINSYNYDFFSNKINVTQVNNFLSDEDYNLIQDKLNIEILTNNSNSNYIAIIILSNKNNNLINYNNITQTNTNIQFNTEDIYEFPLNYTIEIRDNNYNLLYLKNNFITNNYTTYEKGPTINSIQDSLGNTINLSLDLNVEKNLNSNITIYLEYKNKTIEEIINKNLITPQTIINFPINKTKLALTHHHGTYKINKVKINNKILSTNYTTNYYNFEDFTQDSYIKEITYNLNDTNANNLQNYLNFNFQIQTKDLNDYSLTYNLYTENDIFIRKINETFKGTNSLQLIESKINTTDLYKLKENIKYKITNIKLVKLSKIVDFIDEFQTNQINYLSLERPNLPDLILNLSANFDEQTNITNLTIKTQNKGKAAAFNINLDIFSLNMEDKIIIPYLNVNQTYNHTIMIQNDSQGNIYTSIIDLQNQIDESNESNNIKQTYSIGPNTVKLDSQINVIDNNLIELRLENTGYLSLYDLNINFNNHNISNINLEKGQTKIIFLPLTLELSNTYPVKIKNNILDNDFYFNYDYSDYKINYSILEQTNNQTLIEYIFSNNENQTINFKFDNKMIEIKPLSKLTLISDKLYNQTPQFITHLLYEKGLMEDYIVEINNIKAEDINSTINVLESGLNNLIELIFNSKYSTNLEYELLFSNNIKLKREVYLNSNQKSIVFIDYPSNQIDITLKSISYLNETFNITIQNFNNSNEYILNKLDINLTEIIIENNYLETKIYTFTFNNREYEFILSPNEKKTILIESNSIISNFSIKSQMVIESFNQLDSHLYEIILNNFYDSSKVINFNLGGNPHSYNLNKNERKVVLIDINQDNLEIQNLEVN